MTQTEFLQRFDFLRTQLRDDVISFSEFYNSLVVLMEDYYLQGRN